MRNIRTGILLIGFVACARGGGRAPLQNSPSQSSAPRAAVASARGAGEQNVESQDKARPEVELFLPEAAEQMEDYKKKHGRYAKSWNELNFSFSAEPYHLGDPGIYPPKDAGNHWKPKECHYTYVIKSATNEQFLIHAVNGRGIVEYEIRQGMASPVPVSTK